MGTSYYESIKESMSQKTTDELLDILSQNNHDEWSAEAFKAAHEILDEREVEVPSSLGTVSQRRNLENDETLIFDVPCRSNSGDKPAKALSGSFMGRLVLTNSRLMFLSSGRTGAVESVAKAVIFGGVAASLMRGSMERQSVKNIDISDLTNDGSWQFPLSKFLSCEKCGKLIGALFFAWLGPFLRVHGLNDEGKTESFCLFRGEIKGERSGQLRQLIADQSKLVERSEH